MGFGFERPTLSLSGTTLFSVVTKTFEERRWRYERMQGQPALTTAFRGTTESWRSIAAVNESERQVALFSIVDAAVAPEHRAAVTEVITRANYGLGLGNFEMNLDQGEVRCKTCLSVDGSELTPAQVANLVRCNCELMERYATAIRQVAIGAMTPAAAIEHVG